MSGFSTSRTTFKPERAIRISLGEKKDFYNAGLGLAKPNGYVTFIERFVHFLHFRLMSQEPMSLFSLVGMLD